MPDNLNKKRNNKELEKHPIFMRKLQTERFILNINVYNKI